MIVQITITRNELFLIKEMMPLWQKYSDGFVFMLDRCEDGTLEYLTENKEKFNILSIISSEIDENDRTTQIESNFRQKLYDEGFKYSGKLICMDSDEYLDGTLTKKELETWLDNNPDTLLHAQWIQYTGTNEIRVDGPWQFNLKDRIASYSTRAEFKTMQMHSEHLPVPKNQARVLVPMLFIAHLQWLDKETVAIKQYYWKITDYVRNKRFGTTTIPASAYDASVNNFDWEYNSFDFPLKVRYEVYPKENLTTSYKYKYIRESIKQYNIPNLNDWGMGIHNGELL